MKKIYHSSGSVSISKYSDGNTLLEVHRED